MPNAVEELDPKTLAARWVDTHAPFDLPQGMLLAEHSEREQILKNTLVAAQRTSEEIKENAKKQSQMTLREAELAADRLVEAAQMKAHDIEKDILELRVQKRQVQNSILATIANLRNLIKLMEESEIEQDKISFLRRRGAAGGKETAESS